MRIKRTPLYCNDALFRYNPIWSNMTGDLKNTVVVKCISFTLLFSNFKMEFHLFAAYHSFHQNIFTSFPLSILVCVFFFKFTILFVVIFVSNFVNCLPKEQTVVEPIKSRNVVQQTILGGSTLVMCTHSPPKLLHDVTFGRHSNALSRFIDLLFERPYLIKGLKLMIPTFAKSTDFTVVAWSLPKSELRVGDNRCFWHMSAPPRWNKDSQASVCVTKKLYWTTTISTFGTNLNICRTFHGNNHNNW